MDGKGQKAVRIEINDICDKFCSNCIFNVGRGKSDCTPKQRNKKGEIISYNIPCPISEKLHELGKMILSRKKPIKRERKKTVTKVHLKYCELFNQGLSNNDVQEIMQTTRNAVHGHRKKWLENRRVNNEKG